MEGRGRNGHDVNVVLGSDILKQKISTLKKEKAAAAAGSMS